jgi:hypothetical protein
MIKVNEDDEKMIVKIINRFQKENTAAYNLYLRKSMIHYLKC